MNEEQKRILVDERELEFDNRVFRLAVFIHGHNASYGYHLALEKLERKFIEYFQLLQSYGYKFRKKEYSIVVVIRRLYKRDGFYTIKRKKIYIDRQLLDESRYDCYVDTLFHELTHYFIDDSWNHQNREHLKKPHYCNYFDEGLACLLPLILNQETTDKNPFLEYVGIKKFQEYYYGYYLAKIFFRHPRKFSKILGGYFLCSQENLKKMERLLHRLLDMETEYLNSLQSTQAWFIISTSNSRKNQTGYALTFDHHCIIPLVSPVEKYLIERAEKATIPIVQDNQIFRVMERRVKVDFTPLPVELFSAIVKTASELKHKGLMPNLFPSDSPLG